MTHRLRDYTFVCAHNAYMHDHLLQVFCLPRADAYKEALALGIRSLEIDLHPRGRVHHGPLAHPFGGCFGMAPTFRKVINTIAKHAFEFSTMGSPPLILFIENHCTQGDELDEAARVLQDAFGDKIWQQGVPWDVKLQHLHDRVVIVSSPLKTASSAAWNRLVCDSPYSNRMLNVPAVESNRERVRLAVEGNDAGNNAGNNAGRVVRVYPRNIVFSSNYDPEPWIRSGHCTFVSWNVLTPSGRALLARMRDAASDNGCMGGWAWTLKPRKTY
jgi:hypothetical protein